MPKKGKRTHGFQKWLSELSQKLKLRRGVDLDSEDDEGLPKSPQNSTGNKEISSRSSGFKDSQSKSQSSSLLSVGSIDAIDNVVDLHFEPSPSEKSPERSSDLDLEVVTRLDHSGAHHRKSVQPRRTHGAPKRRKMPQIPQKIDEPDLLPIKEVEHVKIDAALIEAKKKCASLPPGLILSNEPIPSKGNLNRSKSNASAKTEDVINTEETGLETPKSKNTDSFFSRLFQPRKSAKKTKQKQESNFSIRPNALIKSGPAYRQRIAPQEIPFERETDKEQPIEEFKENVIEKPKKDVKIVGQTLKTQNMVEIQHNYDSFSDGNASDYGKSEVRDLRVSLSSKDQEPTKPRLKIAGLSSLQQKVLSLQNEDEIDFEPQNFKSLIQLDSEKIDRQLTKSHSFKSNKKSTSKQPESKNTEKSGSLDSLKNFKTENVSLTTIEKKETEKNVHKSVINIELQTQNLENNIFVGKNFNESVKTEHFTENDFSITTIEVNKPNSTLDLNKIANSGFLSNEKANNAFISNEKSSHAFINNEKIANNAYINNATSKFVNNEMDIQKSLNLIDKYVFSTDKINQKSILNDKMMQKSTGNQKTSPSDQIIQKSQSMVNKEGNKQQFVKENEQFNIKQDGSFENKHNVFVESIKENIDNKNLIFDNKNSILEHKDLTLENKKDAGVDNKMHLLETKKYSTSSDILVKETTKIVEEDQQQKQIVEKEEIVSKTNHLVVDSVNVVLRRKNPVEKSSNKKEETPELMKVFARRSLKLRDSDELFEIDVPLDEKQQEKSENLENNNLPVEKVDSKEHLKNAFISKHNLIKSNLENFRVKSLEIDNKSPKNIKETSRFSFDNSEKNRNKDLQFNKFNNLKEEFKLNKEDKDDGKFNKDNKELKEDFKFNKDKMFSEKPEAVKTNKNVTEFSKFGNFASNKVDNFTTNRIENFTSNRMEHLTSKDKVQNNTSTIEKVENFSMNKEKVEHYTTNKEKIDHSIKEKVDNSTINKEKFGMVKVENSTINKEKLVTTKIENLNTNKEQLENFKQGNYNKQEDGFKVTLEKAEEKSKTEVFAAKLVPLKLEKSNTTVFDLNVHEQNIKTNKTKDNNRIIKAEKSLEDALNKENDVKLANDRNKTANKVFESGNTSISFTRSYSQGEKEENILETEDTSVDFSERKALWEKIAREGVRKSSPS